MFLWLEDGMRFKAFIMIAILNFVLWKYIRDGNCDYFTLLSCENPSISRFVASIYIEQSKVHKWIMVMVKFKLRNLRFQERNIIILAIKTFMAKLFRFPSQNQWVQKSILLIITEKTSNVGDGNKPRIYRLF